ncbi:type II toxin-antitoxin system HicB family antitoxin [Epilithonimonas hominis]|uniref:type II toxin-antitoxin system HicB family antitoxin n=1 Tax=Epilithonimonas hominis TaxID=420404 RepID=UPI0028997618|nr:hypothetical protein [Epilithonimonas hominis]
MNIKEKIELRNLQKHLPQIQVKNLIEEDVINYKKFLETNLIYSIEQICTLEDDEEIKTIQGITFPFRTLDICFSIEFLNSNYNGNYTVWCPELRGCITEGKSKKEAFENLLYAISEVLIINYDYLNHNPLIFPTIPLPSDSNIDFPKSIFPHTINSSFIKIIIEEYGFDNLYIGKKHFILKEDNENGASLTILFRGVNDLTKFCFDQIL